MSSPQQFARVGEDSAGFSQFSSNKYLGTKEFLESNSIVAKFAFCF